MPRKGRRGNTLTIYPVLQTMKATLSAEEPLVVCLGPIDGTVHLEVASPSGSRLTRWFTFKESDVEQLVVPRLPAGPGGTYVVNVIEGTSRRALSVQVTLPAKPALHIEPQTMKPGSTATLSLAGLPAGKAVGLHIYRPADAKAERYRYVTTLRLRADVHGRAYTVILTDPDDAPATYRFTSTPELVDGQLEIEKP